MGAGRPTKRSTHWARSPSRARAAAAADRVLFLADGRIVGDLGEPTEDQIIAAMREAAR